MEHFFYRENFENNYAQYYTVRMTILYIMLWSKHAIIKIEAQAISLVL